MEECYEQFILSLQDNLRDFPKSEEELNLILRE